MLYKLNDFFYPLHGSSPMPMFIHGSGKEFETLIAHYVEWINHYGYDSVIYDGKAYASVNEVTLVEQIENKIKYHGEYVIEDYITTTKLITSPQEYDPSITTHYLENNNTKLLEQIISHCTTNHNPKKYNAVIIVYEIETIAPHIIDALIRYSRVIILGDCSQLANHSTLRQRGSYILCENLSQRNLEIPHHLKYGQGVYWTSYHSGLFYVNNNIEQLYQHYQSIISRIVRILHQQSGVQCPVICGPIYKQYQQKYLPQEYFYTINHQKEHALDLWCRCEQGLIHNDIKGIALLEREDEVLRNFIIQFGTMIKQYVEGIGEFDITILSNYCNNSHCIIPLRYQENLLYQQNIYF